MGAPGETLVITWLVLSLTSSLLFFAAIQMNVGFVPIQKICQNRDLRYLPYNFFIFSYI